MPRITPIPTTRVSDSFASQRLLTQLQYDQQNLLKIQQQISTGQRILLPSEDAPAALRAISLQKLLEQKDQVKINLTTNQSYLSATDSALAGVSNLLNETRGSAQAVSSTAATSAQREATAQEIDRALEQLVSTANQKFRDRFLFAGAKTGIEPFTYDGDFVRYNGDEEFLQSYSDTDILFDTNIPGSQVFGGFSAAIEGTVDLNPALTWDTPLSSLDLGGGIALGSLRISDGAQSANVDLSAAHDLRDVKKLLEANPPAGRVVTVNLTNNRLTIELDAAGGGNLFIGEVGQGTTAADLELLNNQALGTGPLASRDLQPAILPTTPLADLLGSRAGVTLVSPGPNNDLRITALTRGPAANGYTFNFVDSGTVNAGAETVAYNAGTQTFTVDIDGGFTTANHVAAALAANPSFNALFSVAVDQEFEPNTGGGIISLTTTGMTANGTGTEFDQNSGLNITNGGVTTAINLDAANTVEDLLNILNGSAAQILAEINDTRTGINVRSRLSGTDFRIGEQGGNTAAQLGLKTLVPQTKLSSLNHGLGVQANPHNTDFEITRRDGTILKIDVDGLETVQEVLDAINNHPGNLLPGARVQAQLDQNGQGITLTDNSPGANAFTIARVNSSQAAVDLGLIPVGQTDVRISGGGPTLTLTGRDTHQAEVASVFTSLIRLRDALRANDPAQIIRSFGLLDASNEQINFSRAELGARQQGLDTLETRLEDEEVELKSALSQEIDVDLTEAISNLAARQAAFQASLQMTSQTAKLTLLDFL
ncbi:MAG: flagellar hook-associated protein FlgL [Pirellulales bacterium]|nr:flagellar hook-associated protein FlgL [Pirellulales bacterium]